ncbi:MAG: hypothetical protein PUK46_02375 [Ruminococcus sp.]|nr:hypothetical protein [Ruminococcus sp.]
MSMTWKDVKLATLQKMFAADGSIIPTDESTTDYLAGMPMVANEALERLSTAGKSIVKSVVIAHNPLKNLISDEEASKIHSLGTYEFSGDGAHAYFFEFTGKGTLMVTVGGTECDTIQLESKNTYTEYRGLLDNPLDEDVALIFISKYPSAVKNVALYYEEFDKESEVPEYAEMVRYNLKEICPDFYQLGDNQIYYEGSLGCGYIQTSKYYRESDNILVLGRDDPGSYTVYYRAYPPTITAETADDYVLPVDDEVVVLLPLYMASQLYKDDDNGIATTYRNEFEVALESLIDSSMQQGYEEFTSESGWI